MGEVIEGLRDRGKHKVLMPNRKAHQCCGCNFILYLKWHNMH